MGVTIKDVAEEAGVSVATVSRVLNGSSKVRERTRKSVADAAQALQYVPNETARSLIKNRTHTIGVLLPDMHGEFFAEVIRGIEQTAQGQGYHLLVSSSHSEEEKARAMIRTMLGRVDGLIIMWPRPQTGFFSSLIPEGLPAVLLNAGTSSASMPVLSVDNRGGAREMVRHLIDHGHRRIAILKGLPDNPDAQERLSGYWDALKEAGIERDPELEIAGDFMQSTGYQAVEDMLNMDPRPTALFAVNDAMAMGALSRLQKEGVRVPEDVAVAGFDDVPSAQYVTPPLSTVRVPMRILGERAIEHLFGAMQDDKPPAESEMLSTELFLRASCGCGRSTAG